MTPPPGGKPGQTAQLAAAAPAERKRAQATAMLITGALHGLALATVAQGWPAAQVDTPATPPRVVARLIMAPEPAPTPAAAIAPPPPPPAPVAEMSPPVAKPHRPVHSKPRPAPPRKPAPELAAPVDMAVPPAPAATPAPPTAAPTVAKADSPPVESEPSLDAAYLNNPPPAYPSAARRQRQQGQVMLRVQVEPDGHPARVEVARSSGHRALDRAARAAVERWQFVPARRGEEAVMAWVMVPVRFALNR